MPEVTIALSKGRILEDTLPLLARLGLEPAGALDGRQLRVPSRCGNAEFLIIRPTDVLTYVQYGAADMGIVGKDVLLEHVAENLYEPVDLKIANCRLSLAGLPGAWPVAARRRPRIATKFSNITRRYFAERGEQVELIKLYGSMELAPLVGLADAIVDLVDTGSTLKANGLVEYQQVTAVSARLVVNKASMKTKHARLGELLGKLREVLGDA